MRGHHGLLNGDIKGREMIGSLHTLVKIKTYYPRLLSLRSLGEGMGTDSESMPCVSPRVITRSHSRAVYHVRCVEGIVTFKYDLLTRDC